MSDQSDILALEYSSVKVPYELLNKRFRFLQKSLERDNCRLKESVVDIERRLHGRNTSLPVDMVSSEVDTLIERLRSLRDHLVSGRGSETEMATLLQSRLDYLLLRQTTTTMEDGECDERWKQQRIDRLVIDHLLRIGLFDSAQRLADVAQVNGMCNRQVFTVAKKVEEALLRHDVTPCLEWIMEHKSKLRRLRSELELQIRTQQFIELVRNGDILQAVLYSRRYFSLLTPDQWTMPVQQVMGLLAFGTKTKLEHYHEVVDENRWLRLVELFREENARVFQLSELSVFGVCLQTGISALKTPHCSENKESKCAVCHPTVFPLAHNLPYAHTSQSRLICAYSGEPLNEHNQPMMLSNGMVYGEKSISALADRDGNVICPRTNYVCPLYQVVRVYVM